MEFLFHTGAEGDFAPATQDFIQVTFTQFSDSTSDSIYDRIIVAARIRSTSVH